MTREEKIRICIMLVDGHSFREIGDEMGYSHETIRSAAREIMSGMKQKCQCVFPRINQYMKETGRKPVELADKMCYTAATVYTYFSGRAAPSPAFRESLEKVTGIPQEELFEKRKEE